MNISSTSAAGAMSTYSAAINSTESDSERSALRQQQSLATGFIADRRINRKISLILLTVICLVESRRE